VDDPASRPEVEQITDEEERSRWINAERVRLFRLIERLVTWENSTNEDLLKEAWEEILRSTDGKPPPILDPFAGGGTIPLEAQRLGLTARGSDLNPVAVLINKALIEIPRRFAGRPPIFPDTERSQLGPWPRATGLAEDVRRYGSWMRDQARKQIGHLYPNANLSGGVTATVIAWIWARTVRCPNPACGISMPLVRSWWLRKKKGKEAYIIANITNGRVQYRIGHDPRRGPTKDADGTVGRAGATCIACNAAADLRYIRAEGQAGRLGAQLMATVAEGNRQRTYMPPTAEHETAALVARPSEPPAGKLADDPRAITAPNYGMEHFADLFTNRQLVAMTTLSDLTRLRL
jgi:putative DNA methylase